MPNRFRQDEIEKLLDLTEEQLPMGAESWQIVAADYNHWCIDKGYDMRALYCFKAFMKVSCFKCFHITAVLRIFISELVVAVFGPFLVGLIIVK
jgi:hypothetical protein